MSLNSRAFPFELPDGSLAVGAAMDEEREKAFLSSTDDWEPNAVDALLTPSKRPAHSNLYETNPTAF